MGGWGHTLTDRGGSGLRGKGMGGGLEVGGGGKVWGEGAGGKEQDRGWWEAKRRGFTVRRPRQAGVGGLRGIPGV